MSPTPPVDEERAERQREQALQRLLELSAEKSKDDLIVWLARKAIYLENAFEILVREMAAAGKIDPGTLREIRSTTSTELMLRLIVEFQQVGKKGDRG